MKKRYILPIAALPLLPLQTMAACCGFELAEATNAGLQTMTKTLQGTPDDGKSFSSLRRELQNANNNLMVLGQMETALQGQQALQDEERTAAELNSMAEIARREALADVQIAVDKAYGAFDKDAACKQYDQAQKQMAGSQEHQKTVGAINNAWSRFWKGLKHPSERTEAVLNLKGTDVDDILPASGTYTSAEQAAEAVKAAAFIVNPYPQAQLDEDEWQGHPFGEKWKEENNILDVRLAPVKAAMSDVIASYVANKPLDKRMEAVLELSPYTKEQVAPDGMISKNLYLELLASSRYYNPQYTAQITAARGDTLIRESIYSYADLLYLENEALKIEQQNTALLAVIASQAINARTHQRLSEAAHGVASHY